MQYHSPFITMIRAWLVPLSSSFFLREQPSSISTRWSEPELGSSSLLWLEAYVSDTSFVWHIDDNEQGMLIWVVEVLGYIGRAMSSRESPNWTLGPYLIQTLFLLLAPALLAASIYMLLGRIILVLQAESHAIMRKKWLTKVFVTGDVLSFLLQGSGGYYID